MAAVAVAMTATRGTLAIPGALVSQPGTRIGSLSPGTRGAPMILTLQTTLEVRTYSAAPESLRAMVGNTYQE